MMSALFPDRKLNAAYGLVVAMVVLSLLLTDFLAELHFVSKPLIMIVLFVWYLRQTAADNSRAKWALVAGICFSWLGDVLLMFSPPLFFIGGLASFLLAHIGYCVAFLRSTPSLHEDEPVLKRKPFLLLLFIAYYTSILRLLWGGLKEMQLPVIVYASVITCMAALALNRWKRVPYESFGPVFAGALLFVVSDSVLAINRFYLPLPNGHFWVMITYMAAQYLIVTGYARMQTTRI